MTIMNTDLSEGRSNLEFVMPNSSTMREDTGMEFEDEWYRAYFSVLDEHRKNLLEEFSRIDSETAVRFEINFVREVHAGLVDMFENLRPDETLMAGHRLLTDVWAKHYQQMVRDRAEGREFAEVDAEWSSADALLDKLEDIQKRSGSITLQGSVRH